jgi:hypothetical protein
MVSVNTGYQFNPEDEEQKKGNFSILGGMINPNSAQTSELSNQGGQTSSAQPTQSSKPPPSGSSQGAPVAQQQYEANKGADQAVFAGSQVSKVKENIGSQQKKANDAFEAFQEANTFSDRFEEGEVDRLASGDQKAVEEFQGLRKAFSGDFENPANFSGAENDIKTLGKSPESFTNRALARGNRALDAALLRGSGAFGNIKSDLEKTLGSAKQQAGGLGEQAKTLQQTAETARQAELAKAEGAIRGDLSHLDQSAAGAIQSTRAQQQADDSAFQSSEKARLQAGLQQAVKDNEAKYLAMSKQLWADPNIDPSVKNGMSIDLHDQMARKNDLLYAALRENPEINFSFGGGQGPGSGFSSENATRYNTLAGLLGLGDVRTADVPGEQRTRASNVDDLLKAYPELALNKQIPAEKPWYEEFSPDGNRWTDTYDDYASPSGVTGLLRAIGKYADKTGEITRIDNSGLGATTTGGNEGVLGPRDSFEQPNPIAEAIKTAGDPKKTLDWLFK